MRTRVLPPRQHALCHVYDSVFKNNRRVAAAVVLTGVVDALAVGPVEGSVAEVGAAGGADEHALRENRAEDDHRDNGLREVHRLGGRVYDASVDGTKDNASAGSSVKVVPEISEQHCQRCPDASDENMDL